MKRAAIQLLKELKPAVLEPLTVLAGAEAASAAQGALEARVEQVIEEMSAPADSDRGQEEADAVLTILFAGDQPPAEWWDTQLGRLVAVHCSDTGLTQAMASEILGLKRGTISVLVKRGTLATVKGTEPRRVSRRSVLNRKIRLADKD